MSSNDSYEALVNSKFHELDLMVNEYNAIDCNHFFTRKYEHFL